MDVYRAQHAYWLNLGQTRYRVFRHKGFAPYIPPFDINLPIDFLQWDQHNGVMAFPRSNRPHGLCRCGVIEKVSFFKIGETSTILVGLKIMDKGVILQQMDDAENEIRIMHQLQPAGLTTPRANPHFLLWEYKSDIHNEYIATEYADYGAIVYYVRTRFTSYKRDFIRLQQKRGSSDMSYSTFLKEMRNGMLVERLCIFADIIYGIAYMHGQNVCHLDLDPRNLVVDKDGIVKIIDFGSSVIMDGRGYAGTGYELIKFKPPFVAPEVRHNNTLDPPRPGFCGRAADMYAAGVILYQILAWGYPKGDMALTHDAKWKYNLFQHIHKKHPKAGENCFLCYREVYIPDFILEILGGLLSSVPRNRIDAIEVAQILQDNIEGLSDRRVSGPRARSY